MNIGGLTDSKVEYIKAHLLNEQDIILLQEIKKGKIYYPSHTFKRRQSKQIFTKQGLCLGFLTTKFKIIDQDIIDPDRMVVHTLTTNNNTTIKIVNMGLVISRRLLSQLSLIVYTSSFLNHY